MKTNNHKTTKSVVMLMCVLLMLGIFTITAMAAEIVDSGECDGDAVWTIDENNVITVSADGKTDDGVYYMGAIWTTHYRDVEKTIIEEGITKIGVSAFSKFTNMTTVEIPASVVEIEERAFKCGSLQEIIVSGDNPVFCAEDGVLYNKDKTKLICVPDKTEGQFVIPDGVKTIGKYAFDSCIMITEIIIPDSVTRIEDFAFANCNLDKIIIPKDVSEISNQAFDYSGVREIAFENDNMSLSSFGFFACPYLESITIKDGNKSGFDKIIEEVMENEDNLYYSSDGNGVLFNKDKSEIIYVATDVEIIVVPESVESIRKNAFSYCKELKIIEFLGDAPAFAEGTFSNVTANVFFNRNIESWTEDVIKSMEAEGQWVKAMPKNEDVVESSPINYGVLIGIGILVLSIFAFSLPGYIKQEREKAAESVERRKDEGENE